MSVLQLQEVFSTYKKERVESDKTTMKQNDKLQEQLSELHSKNAKISTQLEFVSKRQDKPEIQLDAVVLCSLSLK